MNLTPYSSIRSLSPSSISQYEGLVDRLCRKLVHGIFAKVRYGRILFSDPLGTSSYGNSDPELDCAIRVNTMDFYRNLILRTNVGISAGESYVRGDWEVDDLVHLIRLILRNRGAREKIDTSPFAKLRELTDRFQYRLKRNSILGSKKNIEAHYDLGNEFYRLFLDETMSYSCAYYSASTKSLYDASIAKIDRLCKRLELNREDHLLEIGTGWGAFAIRACQEYGCRVTTTTISEEQYRLAKERVAEAGLSDHITVLKEDYRNLRGQFDKLVSVEMIEAVGYEYLDEYLKMCSDRIKPGGRVAIQAITMPCQEYDEYLTRTDFIQKHIFPGSHLPSVSQLMECVKRSTDLRMIEFEEHGLHYARTLKQWRKAFHENVGEVRNQGFGEEFVRKWDFYLAYCEAAFAENYTGCCQIVFQKHPWA